MSTPDLISLGLLIAAPLLGAWLLRRYEKHSEHTESDRLAERELMRQNRR